MRFLLLTIAFGLSQMAWALTPTELQFDSVDAYTASAIQAIENATNRPLDQNTFKALKAKIGEGEQVLSRPRQISDDGRSITLLGCIFAAGDLPVPGMGAGTGATAMVCYDWRKSATYLIGGVHAGIAMGAAGGVGLVTIGHDDIQSIEATYVCGNAGAAVPLGGARGMYCAHADLGAKQWVVFVGFQSGAIAELGGVLIRIVSLENAEKAVRGLLNRSAN